MSRNLVPVFDEAGNYMKDVFSRYAHQRVIKGQARWTQHNSAIQVIKPCPILSVFTSVGSSLPVSEAMKALTSRCFPNDPYARFKAAGALGGSSRSGVLIFDNGTWRRAR